ncbi:hypothetical protein L218DRAFT_945265 [Marasmius fiardii PR-910]|nr:hypothetical protein L218DRAFT_945265 [Marasmius fiardii PR-910]
MVKGKTIQCLPQLAIIANLKGICFITYILLRRHNRGRSYKKQWFPVLCKLYCNLDTAANMEAVDDMLAEQEVAEAFSRDGLDSKEDKDDPEGEINDYGEDSQGPEVMGNNRHEVQSSYNEGNNDDHMVLDVLPSIIPKSPPKDLVAGTTIKNIVNEHSKSAIIFRLMEQLEKFAHAQKLTPEGQKLFSASPCQDALDIICAWIMEQCDSITIIFSEHSAEH